MGKCPMEVTVVAKKIDLSLIKGIEKSAIPPIHKDGIISNLPQLAEVRKIAAFVKQEGASPYEAFDVADFVAMKKARPELAKMKTLVYSFLMATRRILKEYQVEKKLEVVGRKDRVFLVSVD